MAANAQQKNYLTDAPIEAHKHCVLIVDDEKPICETLANVLEDEGFATVSAATGEQALEIVQNIKPTVVFLDIWMPGWDGIETLERIKAVAPETEVIMISGHATISNAIEATRRGAFDFIEKPLDIESIIDSLRKAVERAKKNEPILTQVEIKPKIVHKGLTHPGLLSQGIKGENVGQRTLKRSTILYGQCLHSGQKSGLVLEPLPLNSGIHFGKIGDSKTIPAYVDYVESTSFATTLRSGSIAAGTIEHLMSALHAYKISNLLVKCNDEVPIFDGSAEEFCRVIESVGIEEQGGEWFEIAPSQPIEIQIESKKGEQISLLPCDHFCVAYELDYPQPVGVQRFEFHFRTIEDYRKEIASARTFGFMRDIEKLQRAGLAAGGRLDNFVLFGDNGIINTKLRFDNEPARHKILDIVGDLFLVGRPLRCKVVARMTGHADNVSVLKAVAPLAVV